MIIKCKHANYIFNDRIPEKKARMIGQKIEDFCAKNDIAVHGSIVLDGILTRPVTLTESDDGKTISVDIPDIQ